MAVITGLLLYLLNASGEAKFLSAVKEVDASSQVRNPCLGTTFLRHHSYLEIGLMSIEEVKNELNNDPGLC